jgi:hypothetical protein
MTPPVRMTEAEWLHADDPAVLLYHMPGWWPSWRQHRLYLCACCRREETALPPLARAALLAAEQYADGQLPAGELVTGLVEMDVSRSYPGWESVLWLIRDLVVGRPPEGDARGLAASRARRAVGQQFTGEQYEIYKSEYRAERAAQAAIVRDILGNPFRPPQLDPAWIAHAGGAVVAVARGIYEDQRYDDLYVLADVLEEAGCADAPTLEHCRSGAAHVRGCWVLDLLLGNK